MTTAAKIRIPLDPQPKYGKPFQVVGDSSGRFYNVNPSYPRSGPMISYSWLPASAIDPSSVCIEYSGGVYEWVGITKESA